MPYMLVIQICAFKENRLFPMFQKMYFFGSFQGIHSILHQIRIESSLEFYSDFK